MVNSDYLKNLNEAQKQAVLFLDGPLLIVAGAGSGKTKVLTSRIAHIIKNKKAFPNQILAVTFTNKAAKEMQDRVSKILGSSAVGLSWLGTFHSICAKLLRKHASAVNLNSNFTIVDTDDQIRLIKNICKAENIDIKQLAPRYIIAIIDKWKNKGLYPSEVNINPKDIYEKTILPVYKIYQQKLIELNACDFGDLILHSVKILEKNEDIRKIYSKNFKYILVDEYQDTNNSQYLIVKSLSDKYQNICVVGDDAQSIYSFRGANINNIINFRNDYDDIEIFRLEQNYRSTKNIVNAANSVIDHNKNKIDKEVWTENDFGDKVQISSNQSDIAEARSICQKIQTISDSKLSEIAILYRTNAQSRPIEDSLRLNKIPYRIFGGVSFYNRKEIKDILAYLRLIVNSNDEESLKRVINYPARGIGLVTINKIIISAQKNSLSLYDTIKRHRELNIPFSNSVSLKLQNFVDLIEVFKIENEKLNAFDLTKELLNKVKIIDDLKKDESPEGISRVENVQELLNGIRDFIEDQKEIADSNDNLSEFLSNVSLSTDFDLDYQDEDYISLMTLHLSKGLEFKHVFIVGLEEDLFPSALSYNTRSELEEERRLFYVGITRAKENLYLSYANSRYRWGKLIYCEESRFLNEIDKDFVDVINHIEFGSISNDISKKKILFKPKGNLRKLSSSIPENNSIKINFSEGDKVSHEKFGNGIIVKIEGLNNDTRATVKFSKFGEKNLLLRFAKLNKV